MLDGLGARFARFLAKAATPTLAPALAGGPGGQAREGDRRLGARGAGFREQMLAMTEALGQGLPFESWGEPMADPATERFAESLRALPVATQIALDNLLHAIAQGPLPVPMQQVAFQAIARLAFQARADRLDTANPLHVREQLEALAAFAEADGHTELGAQALLVQVQGLADQAEA